MAEAGQSEARLYGADPEDGVDGFGAFFLLLDEPEAYGLPPDPVATTHDVGQVWAGVPGRRGSAAVPAAIAGPRCSRRAAERRASARWSRAPSRAPTTGSRC